MHASLIAEPVVLPVLAFFALWYLLSGLAALAVPWIVRKMRPLVPAQRSFYLFCYALYPMTLAVVITLIVFAPGLSTLIVDSHCHGKACGGHVPILEVSESVAHAIPWIVATLLLAAIAITSAAIWRSARSASMLTWMARPVTGKSFRVLDSDTLLACCIGVLKPTILLSRGLLEHATPAQVEVILLHERAHCYRGDNLRNLLASTASLTWPAAGRGRLLAELHLAAEQSCDYAVSRATGDVGMVVSTIEAMTRWRLAQGNVGSATFDALNAGARTCALQRPEWRSWKTSHAMSVLAVALLIQIVVMGDALHHLAEVMLQFV